VGQRQARWWGACHQEYGHRRSFKVASSEIALFNAGRGCDKGVREWLESEEGSKESDCVREGSHVKEAYESIQMCIHWLWEEWCPLSILTLFASS
jgi:hypothetical protein